MAFACDSAAPTCATVMVRNVREAKIPLAVLASQMPRQKPPIAVVGIAAQDSDDAPVQTQSVLRAEACGAQEFRP